MAVVANKDVVGATEETPPRYETLNFDLDDTLYPLSIGLAEACQLNIEAYMVEKLGIDAAIVPSMCTKLYKFHGTTMARLWAEGYYFDHDDFHRVVYEAKNLGNSSRCCIGWSLCEAMAAVANNNVVGATEEMPARYETLIFDLDDTLYPLSIGLAKACRLNIEAYIVEKLGIDAAIVPSMCTRLYKFHRTTMAGLWNGAYYFDQDDFHRYVHSHFSYHVFQPDLVLRNLLQNMLQSMYIFTNADKVYADVVLKLLGIEDLFESILCFETFNSHVAVAKASGGQLDPTVPIVPSSPSFPSLQLLQINLTKALYFDNSARNIFGGKQVGLYTVLIRSSVPCEGADHTIASIHNVRESIPEIWAEPHFLDELQLSRKIVVETVA